MYNNITPPQLGEKLLKSKVQVLTTKIVYLRKNTVKTPMKKGIFTGCQNKINLYLGITIARI